jgi:hypothetical protein
MATAGANENAAPIAFSDEESSAMEATRVIASEAKQSRATRALAALDCFVASLLAMTQNAWARGLRPLCPPYKTPG